MFFPFPGQNRAHPGAGRGRDPHERIQLRRGAAFVQQFAEILRRQVNGPVRAGSFRCGTTLTGLLSYFWRRIAKLNVLHRMVRYLLMGEAASSSFSSRLL